MGKKKVTESEVKSDILVHLETLKAAIASGSRADNAVRVDEALTQLEATIHTDYAVESEDLPPVDG